MIDMALELDNKEELFISLVPLTVCGYAPLRNRAVHLIRSMGVNCIEEPYMMKQIDSILKEEREQSTQLQVVYEGAESREMSMMMGLTREFLQGNLYRYLMASCKLPEIYKILQSLTIWGKEDAKKKEEDPKKKEGKTKASIGPTDSELDKRGTAVQASIAELCETSFTNSLDPKQYPKMIFSPKDLLLEPRTILSTLQTPSFHNLSTSLLFLFYEEEERKRLEREARIEQERLRRIQEEVALVEQNKRARELAERSRIAAERFAAEEARKERIQTIRMAKRAGITTTVKTLSQQHDGKKPKIKLSSMQTKGVGHTHHSQCHHSREQVNITYRKREREKVF
jgi:hypothetical protein